MDSTEGNIGTKYCIDCKYNNCYCGESNIDHNCGHFVGKCRICGEELINGYCHVCDRDDTNHGT